MNKHFPQSMIEAARLGKLAFLSDIQPLRTGDCPNCGGMGNFYLFIAAEGPYREPGNPYRSDHKSSKWYDGKWWVGDTHSFQCPDCKGSGEKIRPAEITYRNYSTDEITGDWLK